MFYERGYTCVGLLKDRSFVFGSNLMMDLEVCLFTLRTAHVGTALAFASALTLTLALALALALTSVSHLHQSTQHLGVVSPKCIQTEADRSSPVALCFMFCVFFLDFVSMSQQTQTQTQHTTHRSYSIWTTLGSASPAPPATRTARSRGVARTRVTTPSQVH